VVAVVQNGAGEPTVEQRLCAKLSTFPRPAGGAVPAVALVVVIAGMYATAHLRCRTSRLKKVKTWYPLWSLHIGETQRSSTMSSTPYYTMIRSKDNKFDRRPRLVIKTREHRMRSIPADTWRSRSTVAACTSGPCSARDERGANSPRGQSKPYPYLNRRETTAEIRPAAALCRGLVGATRRLPCRRKGCFARTASSSHALPNRTPLRRSTYRWIPERPVQCHVRPLQFTIASDKTPFP